MLIPIRTDSPLRSIPWMNWLLILANVIAYMVQRKVGMEAADAYALNPRDPHLLNFFTYAFLHAGVLHLASNMLFLYIFGNNVNDKIGNLGYLALYLAGAVFAAVGHLLASSPADSAPVVGASGAVSAITGAYLVLFPRANITVLFFFLFIGAFEVPSMYFILFFFLQDLFLNFAGESRVAHMAHVSGSVFGFAVCLGLLGLRLLPRDQVDILSLLQRWNRRRQYQSLVREGFDPFGHRTVAAPQVPPVLDPRLERLQNLRAQISQAVAHRDLPAAAQLYLQLKALDPQQVMARQIQLDIANQLASQQLYPQAADAYEQLLRQYPTSDQIEKIQLILGLLYARYLGQPARAKELFTQALPRLHDEREVELAKSEIQRMG